MAPRCGDLRRDDLVLYLNGVLDGTRGGASHGPAGFDPARGAGDRDELHRRGVRVFAGVMDESRIWNVARSGAEIAASMNTS